LKKKVKARDHDRCIRCHLFNDLHVHHLTYTNLWHEQLSDLVTLCRHCHELSHASSTIRQEISARIAHESLLINDPLTHGASLI
jgi:5-methylcytosine-specific restriction endonuclease McrA